MGNSKYMMFEGVLSKDNKKQFSEDVIFEVCHSSDISISFNYDGNKKLEVLGVVYSSSMRGADFIPHAIKYIDSGRVIFHDADWNSFNDKEEVELYIINNGKVQKYKLSGVGEEIKNVNSHV